MFIPGRIEVLGKHTDYCGGRSIVCAIDRGFHGDIEPRSDSTVELWNLDTNERAAFDLTDPPAKTGYWLDYAVTVGARSVDNFHSLRLKGCTIRFRSNLPKAAGLSSSSALMIMVFAALDSANDLRSTPEYRANISNDIDLAEYLGCIENGQSFRGLAGSAGVGTFGGSQDHAAILLGKRGMLTRFAFSPLRHEAEFAFSDELSFVVASSGVAAEKTGSALEKYNRVSRMVSQIASMFGGGSLASIIEYRGMDKVRKAIAAGTKNFTGVELLDRINQFHVENYEIIPKVSELIESGRYSEIGALVDLSHQNAENLLHNQVEETIFLQRSAREIGGLAASAFGAGFGGSVYAIVPTNGSGEFADEWRNRYLVRFPQHTDTSEFFTTRPSQIVLG